MVGLFTCRVRVPPARQVVPLVVDAHAQLQRERERERASEREGERERERER